MESEMSQRELTNAKLSQKVAEQGMVLLQNKGNILPLKNKKIALYGSGAFETYKGGTGSGDVNQRRIINIESGLTQKGFKITTLGWLNRFKKAYKKGRQEYWEKYKDNPLAILAPVFSMDDPQISEFQSAPTGIYVISRSSGEGQDRKNEPGDFQLTENEISNIQEMSQFYENSVVLLNVGGVIDTSFIEKCPLLNSVLLVSQPGMQAGLAIADILDGTTTPSGKLTDTWAKDFKDYYSSNSFGQKNPNYQEGIYVGYRYFDSFGITPRYEFGFGLSYTKFFIQTTKVRADEKNIDVDLQVQNIGETYHGSEVVQLYISNPQTDIPTPYQSLQGYAKTRNLYPGEEQEMHLSVPVKNLASYDDKRAVSVLVPGVYVIRLGNSSKNTKVIGEFKLDEEVILKQFDHKLVPDSDPTILRSNNVEFKRTDKVPFFLLKAVNFPETEKIKYSDEHDVTTYIDHERELPGNDLNQTVSRVNPAVNPKLVDVFNGKISMNQLVARIPDKTLINLVEGIVTPEQSGSIVGNGAQEVPGAAGQTVESLDFGIPTTINADGPAGLRLTKTFEADGKTKHQYATAWPIGTLLAQTWDQELVRKVGHAIGVEMKEFGVTMWLAPGMNIHRNPLGGRNFEYFAEDPVLSGTISAAEALGVQENPGIGVTIKHFLGNNQETLRNTGNSIIGEQALREIYLKNFQITVECAQPMAVMTSYNKLNGTFAGENFESITNILRDEWKFEGLVMTDWYSLADPVKSMYAGNDLIMPGSSQDKLLAAIGNLAPEFDKNGMVKSRKSFDIATFSEITTELWNDFVPDEAGDEVVKIDLKNSDKLTDDITDMIYTGVAQIIDNHCLIVSGYWKDNNNLYIGDLQKSVKNILSTIIKTDRFSKLIGEAAVPYNFKMDLQNYFISK
ncbi:glycoside hydrolase family 3 C-terminal domain-containing protein [Companilactobacillus ginsenosidimutans]|uniref:Glycoside hydrolase family 3 n=1 Tax=Companilactobacillus ginsenosidimutans TaxID=1007676 RepID=A0A0H4QCV4_9LACO|nr:glycoside hydrolase family 3 C-terminal domain-containing protein [Companilactobacillus ginsenosidimutans]AKP66164.1 glycoside hydrolase family 3 [Companilactobacillus ginsenosidimutans]